MKPSSPVSWPSITAPALTLLACLLLFDPPTSDGAPLAGVDFDNGAGGFDAAPDDLNLADSVTVSPNWSFGGSPPGNIPGLDANSNTGRVSAPVAKLDGPVGAGTPPPPGGPPPTGGMHWFSITIPDHVVVNLTNVRFAFSKATGSGDNRWLAFRTNLDANVIFSELGVARPGFPAKDVVLSGAQYEGLTNRSIEFIWYSGGQGSGDCDIDSIVIEGVAGPAETDPPTVVNVPAMNVGAVSATLGGEVADNGGADPLVTLYWGDNDGGVVPANWDEAIPFNAQGGTYAATVTGLSPSTTYYFRSHAANSGGEDWADSTFSFTTASPPEPPSVVNTPATGITHTDAELNGTVTSTGGEVPNVTVFFGQTDGGTTPGNWDDAVEIGAESGSFSNSLFFLTHNTTYFFRAFARNSGGSAWAPSTASFTTLAYGLPSVANAPASNITGSAALVGGEVTDTGGDPPEVTVYWGDEDAGSDSGGWDHAVPLGARTSTFSAVLSGLESSRTYHFRTFAQNAAGGVWAGSSESFATLEVSELVLSEFMAANAGGTANNPNGWYPIARQIQATTPDWIEIHNTGSSLLDLGGWRLTDSAADPAKWTFPPGTTLAGGAFLLVYATGENAPDANGNLHTNFSLSAGGEYLALVRPTGSVASAFGPAGTNYPPQDDDISYGLHPTTSEPVFFSAPTPGGANSATGLARVADTRFSPDRGYYQTAINVTIATETAGATIYYTTDGTPPLNGSGSPTAGASAYAGPIAVSRSTPVRAAATKPGYSPTDSDTHSYFLLDIDSANADGTDAAGLNTPFLQQTQPPGWSNLSSGDFNMDPVVSKSTAPATGHATSTAQTMLRGLRDIPTFSLALDRNDFTGPNGLYSNSTSRGAAWERVCSAEFIPAAGDARGDWQENCGIRVQGGASRNPGSSPKHSLSLRFRAELGSGKLRDALFPGSEVEEFNVLSLRAGYNNSWIHSAADQRSRGCMIRDQWMREAMLEMGHPSGGHGFHVHVFINGLYWGIHNLCERADASHYTEYHGGDPAQIDSRNGAQYTDGTPTAWNQISGVVSGGDWTKIRQVLDIDQYIDYQIVNRYGGNADLKVDGNWRAAGGGPFPPGEPEKMAPWELYSWDGERTMEGEGSTVSPLDPMAVRGTLEGNPEYRLRFADRLQKHFFHGGALTPDAAKARWMKYAIDLDRAIIAESARWGDHRGTRYTRDAHWLPEQARLYNTYFPARSANVLNRYRNTDGLFPNTAAPVFQVNATAQHGGEIPQGGTLTLTAASGVIFITTDGSDPRLEGGGVSGSAAMIASGATVALPRSGLVRTRTLNGGEWSPLEEATFYLEPLATPGSLALTEIHYNPYRVSAHEKAAGAALAASDDFEFLEIRNVSPGPVNLDGAAFSVGIDFTFGNLALPSGAHVVLAKDAAAFAARYPAVPIAGTYGGNLDNNGEHLLLSSSSGSALVDFTYGDAGPWPGRPDGGGSSLERVSTAADPLAPSSWRASTEFNGSPGSEGAGPDGRIVINEVLSHPAAPEQDVIELHNTTGAELEIGGWSLSDNNAVYPSFRLPPTTIPGGGYVTFNEDDFNAIPSKTIGAYSGTVAAAPTAVTSVAHGLSTGATITIEGYGGLSEFNGSFEVTVIDAATFTIDTPFLDNHPAAGHWITGRPFALSASRGETLWLVEADAVGRPLRFVDAVDFAAAFEGETLGRWPDGRGTGTLVSMSAGSLGSANTGAQVGPVIISEVMYHPDVNAETEAGLEFVEIHNAGPLPESLAQWRLRGDADFDFTDLQILAPGESLVVVAFAPSAEIPATNAFRTAYGIDASIALVGPFGGGPLGNDTGNVRLQRAGAPPATEPDYFPQVTEDEVAYTSALPWPEGAAGGGDSLTRADSGAFGNFATSWSGASPTPGGTQHDYDSWRETFLGGTPPRSGPTDDFDQDGLANLIEFALALDPRRPDPAPTPAISFDDGLASLSYERHLLRSGIACRVEFSTDLVTWAPVDDVLEASVNFVETRTARIPIDGNPGLYLRLAVDG